MSEKRASVDIGSNSVLLLMAEIEDGQIKQVLLNESRVTGLGRELDNNGVFLEVAQEETFQALKEYRELCLQNGLAPEKIVATATEASRVASNARTFFEKIRKELGINVQIINGEAEAYFSTKGVLLGESPLREMTIMDVGGASTEFITVAPGGEIKSSFSAPFGSVRATNWLEKGVWEERFEEIKKQFEKEFNKIKTDTLHCVAGTMTSLANMHLDHKEFVEKEVHGHILSKEDIDSLLRQFKDFSPKQFLQKFPFLGKRSNAIRGGLFLVHKLSGFLNVSHFKVSTYGLRYGTLIEGKISNGHLFK